MNNKPKALFVLTLLLILSGRQASARDCLPLRAIKQFMAGSTYCSNELLHGSGRLYALLIGINQPTWDLQTLKKPASEVDELAKLLRQQQYAVKVLRNEHARKDSILCWLDMLVNRAEPQDRVLVYFTGHAGTLRYLSKDMTPALRDTLRAYPDDEFFLIPQQREQHGIAELISIRELVGHLYSTEQEALIRQRVVILDACFGGYFVNASPLTNYMFDNELPPDGFYALTSLKSVTYDGEYFPIICKGLRGDADKSIKGNGDGFVGLFELSNYVDFYVGKKHAEPRGESFYSRYIMVGSGELALTRAR